MNDLPESIDFCKKLIQANVAEYGDIGLDFSFITPEQAGMAEDKRSGILKKIGLRLQWAYSRTKPFLQDLSPGCRICGNGAWSCLFINGKCNGHCFYCPAPQDDVSVPTTNRLIFEKPGNYSDYLHCFDFHGAGISGGEPLITFEKTLGFINHIRKNGPKTLHIWMYTNGILLTEDHLLKLKDAGLNEIRFDIGATAYEIKKLCMAVGKIPMVTVEIPAVPEDMEKLGALIPILADSGIDYLNLHQLRMTPHNSPFFKSRHYTLLHGEKVTVLESELAVLSLFAKAIDHGWALPIHYCSFAYKNQFQKAAARNRNAGFIVKPFEALTQNGFIRSIQITGEPDVMESLYSQFAQKNIPLNRFSMSEDKSRTWVHESLWPYFSKEKVEIQLNYYEAVLNQSLSYRNPFKEIRLEGGMKLYVEKQARHLGARLSAGEIQGFEKFVIHKHLVSEMSWPQTPWEKYEFIQKGLQEYF